MLEDEPQNVWPGALLFVLLSQSLRPTPMKMNLYQIASTSVPSPTSPTLPIRHAIDLVHLRCGVVDYRNDQRSPDHHHRRASWCDTCLRLSLIHISEPTRQAEISYAVFCLK